MPLLRYQAEIPLSSVEVSTEMKRKLRDTDVVERLRRAVTYFNSLTSHPLFKDGLIAAPPEELSTLVCLRAFYF